MTDNRFKLNADRIHLIFCFCCLLTFPFMIGAPGFLESESNTKSCVGAGCQPDCSSEKVGATTEEKAVLHDCKKLPH